MEPVWIVVVILGLISLAGTCHRLLKMVYTQVVRPMTQASDHLYQKYAKKDTWAVVTGGSDGIGLAMC